jgi:hypothetical protein
LRSSASKLSEKNDGDFDKLLEEALARKKTRVAKGAIEQFYEGLNKVDK